MVDDVERTMVSDSPRAGLVMAAYNATAYLEQAIEGIATQEFSDFACRIVDDGSTDGTADLARALTAHDSRFVVDEVAQGGQSIARNVGVSRLPMTQYLSFPDADDEWHPDALGALIGAAEAFGGVGAHALATRIDPDGNPFDEGAFTRYGRDRVIFRGLRKQLVPVHLPSSFETLLCTCTVYPPGVWTVRRDVFDRIGGFDPSLRYFEDWDLQIRASRLGEFAFLDKVVVDYRRHPAQISASPLAKPAIAVLRDKTVRSPLNSKRQYRAAAVLWRGSELRTAVRCALLMVKQPTSAVREAHNALVHLVRALVGPGLTRAHESHPTLGQGTKGTKGSGRPVTSPPRQLRRRKAAEKVERRVA
jgi:glycosyltransferase involved in cell wall biosynthesis